MLIAVAFAVLLLASLALAGLPDLGNKPVADWVLDGLGLTVQGTLVPLLQTLVVAGALTMAFPTGGGSLDLPAPLSFLLCFVAVDYLYYWNHRLLHSTVLWPVHVVHHTMTELDVVGTSRNTLWSSALIVYLWVNGAFLWLLADPAPYALAVALTATGDLWRHSALHPPKPLADVLGLVFVLPADHAWHHSAGEPNINFGANLKVWDQLHGTWRAHDALPETLGVPLELSLGRKLMWPFP